MNPRTLFLGLAVGLAACGDPEGPTVIQSLDLTAPKQTIGVGESVQMVATARDPNGIAVRTAVITYISNVPTIATVNQDGRVVGVSTGTTQVTATAGSISQSLTFQVIPGNVAAVVFMQSNTFTPFRTTIRVGQTVMWTFPADAHNVIFTVRTGRPTDIGISSNQDVTRTFNTAGTFPYDCTLHPGMTGEVQVNP